MTPKSFGEVQIPISASYGQRIKVPAMPCGEWGHGFTRVPFRPNVGGICSEMKRAWRSWSPNFLQNIPSSVSLLWRGDTKTCLLCWIMIMFKGGVWTEHQGISEPFEESHFRNRTTLESEGLFPSRACIMWKESQLLVILLFFTKILKNNKVFESKGSYISL